ncbi:MAG: hypothetical protein IBJ18_02460 [Phycisphaerales bacterium]|nr:hypothetical protein [Phycisphaerales bacterium]
MAGRDALPDRRGTAGGDLHADLGRSARLVGVEPNECVFRDKTPGDGEFLIARYTGSSMNTPSETPENTRSDTPMPSQSAGKPVRPTCPRCGYDQSGEVARWTESCPVKGTCPECGLEFAWGDLFDSSSMTLSWAVEYSQSARDFLNRFIRTHVRALNPFSFWSSLQLRSTPRVLPLIVLLVLVVLCPWMIHALARNAYVVSSDVLFPQAPNPWNGSAFAEGWLWPIFDLYHTQNATKWEVRSLLWKWPIMVYICIGMTVLPAILLSVLTSTRTTCRIRGSHILRCQAHAFLPLAMGVYLYLLTDIIADAATGIEEFFHLPFSSTLLTIGHLDWYWHQNVNIIAAIGLVWIALYWCVAINIGLRLKRGWLVTTACLFAGLLGGFSLAFFFGTAPKWFA